MRTHVSQNYCIATHKGISDLVFMNFLRVGVMLTDFFLSLENEKKSAKANSGKKGGYSNILTPLLQGHLEIAGAPIFRQVHYKIVVATIIC